MKRYLRLFVTLVKFKMNRDLVYSLNFWMAFVADVSVFLAQILTFKAIYGHVDTINGWNEYQMIVFVGTFTLVDGLYMATYFFGIISLPDKIRSGNLDLYIIKPINTLFYTAFDQMNMGSLFIAGAGAVFVSYGIVNLGVTMTVTRVVGYIFLVAMMCVLVFALMLITRTFAFRLVKTDSINEAEGQVVEFAIRVPGVAYRGLTKVIFFILIPYGLIATMPTQFITGSLEGKYWFLIIGVVMVFFSLSIFLWKRGLAAYTSASS